MSKNSNDNIYNNRKPISEDEIKVVDTRVICYVSSFYLNVNDWFTEFENIEIFNSNL